MASGKTGGYCCGRSAKGSGPGKTLCDTEEMSVDLQLRLIDFEIGGISAGAKAIIAFCRPLGSARPAGNCQPEGHTTQSPKMLRAPAGGFGDYALPIAGGAWDTAY